MLLLPQVGPGTTFMATKYNIIKTLGMAVANPWRQNGALTRV